MPACSVELHSCTAQTRCCQTQAVLGGWIFNVPSTAMCTSAGRTHQLRRHMAMLGHPILGDRRYHYGWAVQHERMVNALPPTPAAPVATSDGSAGPNAEPRATAETDEHDSPQAVAGQLRSNGSGGMPAQGGAPQAADLRSRVGEMETAQHDAGSAKPEAAGFASAGLCMRSERSDPSADGDGLCLWAVQVDMQHPVTIKQMCVRIPEPGQFTALRAAREACIKR